MLREPRPAGSRSIHLESPEKRFAIRKLTPCLLVPIAGRLERGDPRARCRGEKLRTGDPTSLVGGEDGFVLLVRHSRLSVYQRLKQNTGQVTGDIRYGCTLCIPLFCDRPAADPPGRVGPGLAGTFSSSLRFLRMIDTFTLLSFVMTFLVGVTAGAWVNGLTNSYVLRSGGDPSTTNDR